MRLGDWASEPGVLLAASRHGAIKAATLIELGVPSRTAYRRCAPGGPWQRLLPGVVLLGSLSPTRRQLVEAALLYAGPGAMLSGVEACRWHGLREVPDDSQVHVLVPHGRRANSSNFVVVERTRRMPEPVVRDGVPLAPLTRSVLDACRRFTSHSPARALITEAVQASPTGTAFGWSTSWMWAVSVAAAVPRSRSSKDIVAGARSVAEIDAMKCVGADRFATADVERGSPEPQRRTHRGSGRVVQRRPRLGDRLLRVPLPTRAATPGLIRPERQIRRRRRAGPPDSAEPPPKRPGIRRGRAGSRPPSRGIPPAPNSASGRPAHTARGTLRT